MLFNAQVSATTLTSYVTVPHHNMFLFAAIFTHRVEIHGVAVPLADGDGKAAGFSCRRRG